MVGLRHVLRRRSGRRARSSLWRAVGIQLLRPLPGPPRAIWRPSRPRTRRGELRVTAYACLPPAQRGTQRPEESRTSNLLIRCQMLISVRAVKSITNPVSKLGILLALMLAQDGRFLINQRYFYKLLIFLIIWRPREDSNLRPPVCRKPLLYPAELRGRKGFLSFPQPVCHWCLSLRSRSRSRRRRPRPQPLPSEGRGREFEISPGPLSRSSRSVDFRHRLFGRDPAKASADHGAQRQTSLPRLAMPRRI